MIDVTVREAKELEAALSREGVERLILEGVTLKEVPAAIGNMKDLDAAQLDWVRTFHDVYYAPNHAVLAIAGDFKPEEAMAFRYVANQLSMMTRSPGSARFIRPSRTCSRSLISGSD